MKQIDLTRIDLNLLAILEILLAERSVTATAKRIGRTQSAVSHALARMRECLGDPLLVRAGGQLRTTARAEQLREELTRTLGSVRRLLDRDQTLDPAGIQRSFALCAPDYGATLLPVLVERMSTRAPRARIEMYSVERTLFRDLLDGRFDVVIAPRPKDSLEGLQSVPLPCCKWAVFARRGHPAALHWTVKEWSNWAHIQVRLGGGSESIVDAAAAAQGLQRRLGAIVSHFLMAPSVLANTNLLFTSPLEVMVHSLVPYDLVALESPVELQPIPLHLHWAVRNNADPLHMFLRTMLEESHQKVIGACRRCEIQRLLDPVP
jgi:DNA-binding transcriptional LysR family regulator